MRGVFGLIATLCFGLLLGGLVSDIGKPQPAFVVDWGTVLTAVVLCGGFFLLGYFAGHDDA